MEQKVWKSHQNSRGLPEIERVHGFVGLFQTLYMQFNVPAEFLSLFSHS